MPKATVDYTDLHSRVMSLCDDYGSRVVLESVILADHLERTRDMLAVSRGEPRQRPTLGALYRLAKDEAGNAAIELALLLSVLVPVCAAGGAKLGPVILNWAATLSANIATAQALVATLTGCGQ